MTSILKILEGLSTEKRILLEKKLIEKGSKYNVFPLSYAQQRLWFIEQLQPGSTTYIIPNAIRLEGQLNIKALEESLLHIINRHEILRTHFITIDETPLQIVEKQVDINIDIIDISEIDESNKEIKINDIIKKELNQPFDLSKIPLFRIKLIKLNNNENILLLLMHHIISDGWSAGIFINELSQNYLNCSEGRETSLPPLKIQYGDFAKWQKEWLKGEKREKQLKFWLDELKDISVLELPMDYPRPKVQTFEGSIIKSVLDKKYTDELKQISHEHGTTLFMTLLAAYNVLLYKYSNQVNFAIGTPIANRNNNQVENLIGFFVNTLALPSKLSPNLSFKEYLEVVKETTLAAYSNQDLPFEMLIEELQPDRDMSRSPIFQVMFAFQNKTNAELKLNDLKLQPIEIESTVSKFDLTLNAGEKKNGDLIFIWEYNKDLFSKKSAINIDKHFQKLLFDIIKNPTELIKNISLLSEEDKKNIEQLNQTNYSYNKDTTLKKEFEKAAKKFGDRIAVNYENEHISYQQLNNYANKLANYLINKGVKPELPVGFYLDRSIESIVSILAIWKAGAAYVPLDPMYPKGRIDYMIANSKISHLITIKKHESFFNNLDLEIIFLDYHKALIECENEEDTIVNLDPENLAYLIYTSGSTGNPKGVMISHRAVLNLASALNKKIYKNIIKENLNVSVNAPLAFDASVQQIITLLFGHTLFIVPYFTRLDVNLLSKFIINNSIDVFDCVPSQLRILLNNGFFQGEHWKPKIVLPGGESIDNDMWDELKKISSVKFFNMYGPTEVSVDSTVCEIKPFFSKPSIGKPLTNVVHYILDTNLNYVPIGLPGELCISGDGISRGYINNPKLTAEKFIPNPYSNRFGSLMYKTGDLVKYLDDGNIEFIGRTDDQVKLRGFRIELGEIQSILNSHEGIKQSFLLIQKNKKGIDRLVSYYVSENEYLNSRELEKYLSDRLPEYMIPNYFVRIERIPLTPNGKIDKRALPNPQLADARHSSDFKIATTDTEVNLIKILSDLIGLEEISLNDNFFKIGGHSLLATQLLIRIKKKYGVELPLKVIFEKPVIGKIADEIEQKLKREENVKFQKIDRKSRNNIFPLSFQQQRLWFLNELDSASLVYNIPNAVRLKGTLNLELLQKSLNKLVERHEILRTTFETEEGIPFQKIHPSINHAIKVIDIQSEISEKKDERIAQICIEESCKGFRLNQLPLFRITCIIHDSNEFVILTNIHHIISDGWSSGIIVKEILTVYFALFNNENIQFPDLLIQYADYSAWQREWLKGEVLEKHIEFWHKQLEGAPPLLKLPTDRPRPTVQTFNGKIKKFEIQRELSEGVNKYCKNSNITPFMFLLTVFQILLSKYSRQNDICTGVPVANRSRTDFENLIGFFVNTIVVRNQINPIDNFSELINKVKDSAVSAFAHQEIPFEKIVDYLDVERNVSHSPLFQEMFTYQNLPKSKMEIPGLELESIDLESSISKFDLSLTMMEGDNGFTGGFEYNTDLFEDETIGRMIYHFEGLLKNLLSNPEIPIEKIPLIDNNEQLRVLDKINSAKDVPRLEKFVPKRFNEVSLAFPNNIAVVCDGRDYTYQQLNIDSNKLANYLLGKGINSDSVVGIYLKRSYQAIVSLLGVLKAGAAYLPLEPNYPIERLEYMIIDSGTKLLLTEDMTDNSIAIKGIAKNNLSVLWSEIEKEDSLMPKIKIDGDNLSYIIYTSGSTGKPKGTLITHKGLNNYVSWALHKYPLEKGIGSVVHSTLAFDATVTAVYPALLSGKTLHLVTDKNEIDGLKNILINSDKFSLVKITPAHLDVLSNLIKPEEAKDITHSFVIGGENLTTKQIQYWQKYAPGTLMFNEYGPTENVVGCIVYEASKYQNNGSVPIGKIIPGTEAYVLDTEMNIVPQGIPGELYLSGIALARGYKNRSDLTAEKFVPNPFSKKRGERLYKTGDLVKLRNDDEFEFLGRIDNQVKLRGFRIELGEIESTINSHKDIEQSVVVVRDYNSNIKKLVAYIVAKNSSIENEELESYLSDTLPEYMIPSFFVKLDKIPLTPNGKIDRKALPEPTQNDVISNEEYVMPESEREKILAQIWQDLLGVDKVGIHDNFFKLGGDSIVGIQMISKAKQKGLQISPVQIFQHQTIHKLAAVATKAKIIKAEQGIVSGKFNLIPIQKMFLDNNIENRNHWNQSLLFKVNKKLKKEILLRTVERISMQHDVLRIRVTDDENTMLEILSKFDDRTFEFINLSNEDKSLKNTIESKCTEAQQSLDIIDGPIFKIIYFSINENEGRLLFVFHHIAIDGVSWRILLEDFQILYKSFENNIEYKLPPKTTSVREWSYELNNYLNSESIKIEEKYWLKNAEGYKKNFLPKLKNGINDEKSSISILTSLDEELSNKLLKEVNVKFNTRIDDILLTALLLSYSQWSGKRTIYINLEGHGRNQLSDDIDLSRTVGWFTTIYPLHLNLEKAISIEDSIKIVKEQIRSIPNEGLGYGVLRYLSDEQSIKNKLSVFDSMGITFNYLGQFDNILDKDSIFQPANENKGQERSPNNKRSSKVDITGSVFENRLRINFSFSKNLFEEKNIKEWSELYLMKLKEIIKTCTSNYETTFTSSDFELTNLNNNKLNKVLSKLKKK